MGSLRRPFLAATLLGVAVLVVAAVGLAGPLDPAPDEADGNVSAETGTIADDAAETAGLEKEHDVAASADDYTWRDEPADVDAHDGSASAGGSYGTPEAQADTPEPVAGATAEAASTADSNDVALTFSAQSHAGQVVDAAHAASPVYWDTEATDAVPDAEISAALTAKNNDAPTHRGDPVSLTTGPHVGALYGSSLHAPKATGAAGPAPDRAGLPADGDTGRDDGSSGDGEASTQSTQANPGLTDVVGIDSRAEAVAVAAATALPILVWFLYHRIEGHDVLENETRKAIYDEVCREPGLGVKDLAEAADVSYSTASYHLQRLEDADMIVSSKRGKKLCYFQNGGTYSEDERELLKVLRNEEAMRVFLDIHENPGTYRTRIAERLDVSTTTVNWHLEGLVDSGLVRENRDGRTAHLYVDQKRLDDGVRPLLDKTVDDQDVDVPQPMTQLRSRLGTPATA